MTVENIESLMIAIHTLYPKSVSEKQLPMATERYRAALGDLHGVRLDEAWSRLGATWKKASAPTPADILAAARTSPRSNGGACGTVEAFKAKLAARDDARREDCRKLIEDYRNAHAAGYQTADAEGWLGYLEIQVRRSANMIAQRNERRRAGQQIPDWKPEAAECDDERAETFVPWFSIATVGGVDYIDIDQRVLKIWRVEAQKPGPEADREIKQTTLQRMWSMPMTVAHGHDFDRDVVFDEPYDLAAGVSC